MINKLVICPDCNTITFKVTHDGKGIVQTLNCTKCGYVQKVKTQ